MATYSASKNSVDLAIDPLITCKLCLAERPLQELYELHDCKCLYCESVSFYTSEKFIRFFFFVPSIHFDSS